MFQGNYSIVCLFILNHDLEHHKKKLAEPALPLDDWLKKYVTQKGKRLCLYFCPSRSSVEIQVRKLTKKKKILSQKAKFAVCFVLLLYSIIY